MNLKQHTTRSRETKRFITVFTSRPLGENPKEKNFRVNKDNGVMDIRKFMCSHFYTRLQMKDLTIQGKIACSLFTQVKPVLSKKEKKKQAANKETRVHRSTKPWVYFRVSLGP